MSRLEAAESLEHERRLNALDDSIEELGRRLAVLEDTVRRLDSQQQPVDARAQPEPR